MRSFQLFSLSLAIATAGFLLRASLALRRRIMISRHWSQTKAKVLSVASRPVVNSPFASTKIMIEYNVHATHRTAYLSVPGLVHCEPGSIILARYDPDSPAAIGIEGPTAKFLARLVHEYLLLIVFTLVATSCFSPFLR